MNHHLTHPNDARARLDASGQYRNGASWVAAVIVGRRVEGQARPLTGSVIPPFAGDRKDGRTYVNAGDGAAEGGTR